MTSGATTPRTPPTPKMLPAPVFAILVAAAAAAAAWGLTVAVRTGLTGAIARIVIAAVAIPTLIMPLALRGRRRRAQRDDDKPPSASTTR